MGVPKGDTPPSPEPGWTSLWLRDSGVMLLSQALATVATATLGVLVARGLGPADFGVFSAFLGLSFALSVVMDLGIASWLLRELSHRATGDPRDDVGARELVSSALILIGTLGLAVCLAGLIVAASLGLNGSLLAALVGLLGYTAALGASAVSEAALRARRRLGSMSLLIMAEKFLLLGLVGGALAIDAGLSSIALAYVTAGISRFVLGRALARRLLKMRWCFSGWAAVRGVVRSAAPFALNSGVVIVTVRLDPALVGILSTSAAGYFSAGDRIVGALSIVPVVVASTLYPHLARSRTSPTVIWRAGLLSALVGAVLGLGLCLGAPWLVPWLFGDQFEAAVGTIQVMVLALPFVFLSSPLMAGLLSGGRERQLLPFLAAVMIGGTASVVAGQALAGSVGAAVGYLGRQVLLATALAALVSRMRVGSDTAGPTGTTPTS